MIDSLFDEKTAKNFDDLATKQAKLDAKKRNLSEKSMKQLDSQTLKNVFEVVSRYGHPNEKNICDKLNSKYNLGEELEFEDLLTLDNLYKSNFKNFSNKGVDNE